MLFVRSSVDGRLAGFQRLATVTNIAEHIAVRQVLLEFLLSGFCFVFFVCIPRGEIAESYGNSMVNLLIHGQTVSESNCAILHSYRLAR